jgi:hypothetical protein
MGDVVIHQSVVDQLEALCAVYGLEVHIIEDTYPLNHAWTRRAVVVAEGGQWKMIQATAVEDLPAAVVAFLLAAQ